MHTHRNKRYLIAMVEHSDYIAVLWSLLIGFTIAWALRQPGFHQQPFAEHSAAPALERDLPDTTIHTDGAEQTNPQYGEFLPLEDDKPTAAAWDNHRPIPEIFTKVKAVEWGYLVSFAVSNFEVESDWFVIVQQDEKPIARIYASPYFIANEVAQASSNLAFLLANSDGAPLTINNVPVKEYISFK